MPSLAEQMEALTAEILSSAGDRQEAIASIQTGARAFQSRAREWLTTCSAANRAATEALREELTDGEAARLEFKTCALPILATRLQEIAAETGEWQSASAAQRRATASELVAMAEKLRQELSEGAAIRLDAFRLMHDGLTDRLREIAAKTGKLLAASAESRRATALELVRMGEELQEELAEGAAARIKAFRELHDNIAQRIAELSDDVSDIRRDAQSVLEVFRNDIRAAGEAWQALRQARAGLAFAGDAKASQPQGHPQRSGKKRRPHGTRHSEGRDGRGPEKQAGADASEAQHEVAEVI